MGEEGNEARIHNLEKAFEKDCAERKQDTKDRVLCDEARDNKVTEIKEITIGLNIKLNMILGVLKTIAGLIAAFIVTNLGMFIIQKYTRK